MIVARETWGMPGPLGPAMNLPASVLYLHHSVTAAANGYAAVRTVANIGVQRFGRASYSYACTPDGTLYELQGTHIGAHTAGQNSTALAVVLVGNYETTQISNAQVNAVAWLHRHLTSTGKLQAGAPLRGHRDASGASTACPGRTAYAALPTIRSRITSPSVKPEEGFLMALSDAKQQYLYDRILRIERALAPVGDTLGSYKDSEVPDDRRLGRIIARLDERLSDKTVRWIYQRLQRLEQALTSSESGSLGTFDAVEEERTLRAQVLAELAEIKAAVLSDASQ